VANTFAPFGFSPVNTSNGPMNWRTSTRRIASGNASPIFKGDAVMPVQGSATGYITVADPAVIEGDATHPIAGIFWGCQYLSVSQKRTVWSQYWPGSDANGDVIAYVIDDPNARFKVQTSGTDFLIGAAPTYSVTNFGDSPVGQNAGFATGSGSTATGISGQYLDEVGTSGRLPFIITDMVIDPPGSNGADPQSVYNYVIVGFNNEWLRSNVAVTGIS
jgi:hypothetical protein